MYTLYSVMKANPVGAWYRLCLCLLLDCIYLLNSDPSHKTLMFGDALWRLNTREVLKALDENRELPKQ